MMAEIGRAGRLQRSVGFYGLMFVSLGSIIGSGWLLGALNAARVAGPASILSWLLAAAMLALLALTYAELGAAYPVAGGAPRVPYYCHGRRYRAQRPMSAAALAATSPSATISTALSPRRFHSSLPSARPRLPTAMRIGRPIRSASLNFTPGRSSRSS